MTIKELRESIETGLNDLGRMEKDYIRLEKQIDELLYQIELRDITIENNSWAWQTVCEENQKLRNYLINLRKKTPHKWLKDEIQELVTWTAE